MTIVMVNNIIYVEGCLRKPNHKKIFTKFLRYHKNRVTISKKCKENVKFMRKENEHF